MAHRLNITALMDTLDVSGPAKQLLALIPPLAGEGITLRPLLFQPASTAANPFRDALSQQKIEHDVIEYSGRFDRALLTETQAMLHRNAPDIVQTHSYRPTAVITGLRFRRAPWKWLAFFHGHTAESTRVRMYHALDRLLMGWADQIAVVSSSQLGRFRHARAGVEVINNAFLPSATTESPTRDGPIPLPQASSPHLAIIGRLSHEKGVDIFLEAASMVQEPFVAAVIGEGTDRTLLETMAAERGLSERVRFTGRMDPIGPAYRWADLVVIPSRSEGMPNVLLEAILQGRPVVATDVGNISEIIGETGMGTLVPPESPAALAEAIASRIRNQAFSIDANEREAVLQTYSLQRRLEAHVAIYRRLLAR